MSKPSVLIGYSACQLTREAFERAGVEAWTCDLLPARGNSSRHIQGDVWIALRSRQWSMAVLHPMCTYLTVSAAWAYGDGPYHQKVKPGTLVGAARRAARDEAIENFRRLLALPFPVCVWRIRPHHLSTRRSVHLTRWSSRTSSATTHRSPRGCGSLVDCRCCAPRATVSRGSSTVAPGGRTRPTAGRTALVLARIAGSSAARRTQVLPRHSEHSTAHGCFASQFW